MAQGPVGFFGVYKRKTGTLKALKLRPIGPNNRISGHEDWVQQGQSVHGAADFGLGMFQRDSLMSLSTGICVRFLSRLPIDLGNQHLNRSPQKLIRPGIKMGDIEKAVGSFCMPSAGNQ